MVLTTKIGEFCLPGTFGNPNQSFKKDQLDYIDTCCAHPLSELSDLDLI